MPPERIGLFGGTFDPPHIGHLILASEARHQLGLTRLLWILTPIPPHKRGQPITPVAHRLAMLELALRDEPAFEISPVEIERPGPHFTVDTVHILAEEHPGAELIYLLGGDMLRDLPTVWHRPLDFLRACHALGVMRRPGDSLNLSELEAALPGISAKVRFVDAPLLEIASSEIRRRIAAGRPARYYLPPGVYEYIMEHGLYRR